MSLSAGQHMRVRTLPKERKESLKKIEPGGTHARLGTFQRLKEEMTPILYKPLQKI